MRMIVVDMDGTLVGSDGRVSERNLAAMKAAEKADVEVVVATGRRHCYAMRVLRGLGLGDSGMVHIPHRVFHNHSNFPCRNQRPVCRARKSQ